MGCPQFRQRVKKLKSCKECPSSSYLLDNGRLRLPGGTNRQWYCKWSFILESIFFYIFGMVKLEARVGIEPTNAAFAEPCLTTWLPRHFPRKAYRPSSFSQASFCRLRF